MMKNSSTITRLSLALIFGLMVAAVPGQGQQAADPPMPKNAKSLLQGKTPANFSSRRPPEMKHGIEPDLARLTRSPEIAEGLLAQFRERESFDEEKLEQLREERIERLSRPFGRSAASRGFERALPDDNLVAVKAAPRTEQDRKDEDRIGWLYLGLGAFFATFLVWFLRR